MELLNGELILKFTTKNYMQLKKILKTENLRRALLEAAVNGDYDILATGIKQFEEEGKIKDIDAAYMVIDSEPDKQQLFYEFISALGENGFFEKATPKELKAEANQPNININEIVNKVAPEAAREVMKNSMMTGANTFQISEAGALAMA